MTAHELPRAPEAERAILGGVMLDPARMADLDTLIEPGDFYGEAHQTLYALILAMHDRGEPVETVSVVMEVQAQGKVDECGGVAYVAALPDDVPSTTNLRYYARQIQTAAQCRAIMARCAEASDLARQGKPSEADDVLTGTTEAQRDGVVHMREVIGHIVAHDLPARMDIHASGRRPGFATPWVDLSRLVSPERGHLVIVAARPAMGKSAMVTEWCRDAAANGVGCIQFNLEMTKEEATYRMLGPASGVPFSRLVDGSCSHDDLARVTQAAAVMAEHPLYILDTPGITVEAIRRKARRIVQQDPTVGIVTVDYLTLIGATDRRDRRQEQIAHISRSLKAMAKELGVAVIALAQLNRAVENRADKHPMLADLRESGQIEQDADLIMFLMRPGYYDETDTSGDVDVDIAKQRKGRTGRVVLRWTPETTWFADKPRPEHAPPWMPRGH